MSRIKLLLACSVDNDLYRVLCEGGYPVKRFNTVDTAMRRAPANSAVLSLADSYPKPVLNVDGKLLNAARLKNLRLYLEYPLSVPGIDLGFPRSAKWERMVVHSDFFLPALPQKTILVQHGCWFLPNAATAAHLTLARVAGYRRLAYEFPSEHFPVLFHLPGYDNVLIATTKLSQFVTGRYTPAQCWKALWERLLDWLLHSTKKSAKLTWEPAVRPRMAPQGKLPQSAGDDAFRSVMRWFRQEIVYGFDEKCGGIEGFGSAIDHMGRQVRRTWPRNDCITETAMAFGFDWAANHNPDSRLLAEQMLDYIWSSPDFSQLDQTGPAYGLVNWYDRGPVFYGDDNARGIFASLAVRRFVDNQKWDAPILRCLLANFRTTGKLGFRRNRLDLGDMVKQNEGWRFYFNEDAVSLAPHYQAYLWAAFIWAFALTGYKPFLERTRTAVTMTMEAYPRWKWTNGFCQEQARMILPLAWLVRVEDNTRHREWLKRIADDLINMMQPCGAIQEALGPIETGTYPSPRSNDEYGTKEAALIQENGDPVTDLLYTVNYALLGLHEAAAVTGDKSLFRAENRLADFLCRIQVCSKSHLELDGAWLRGFDYKLWEYYGSSADVGWGAWCAESGWTNSWIAAVLAMRKMKTVLFDDSLSAFFKNLLPGLLKEMKL